MISLQQMPTATLDVRTGKIIGLPEEKPSEPDFGMPAEELLAQLQALAKKGVPIEKVLKAIESHPDIKAKDLAKEFAKKNYGTRPLASLVEK